MATTPLKTASRALSYATVMVVGFAAWVLGTQGTPPRDNAEALSESGRVVEFAAVSATTPASNSQDVAAKKPIRRRLDETVARPQSKPRIDDDTFFDDETPEPTRLCDSVKSQRSSPPRSTTRIQPELGRLSGRDREAIAADDVDELDLADEEVIRQPRAPRTTSRPAMVFRPADVVQDSESARVESHLTALQKKIDQLAQAQTEQKTNDVQKAIETLQQIQESKQTEQIEKLLQQLKDAQPNAADPAKLLEPKSDISKPNAPSEPLADDKPADDNKPGSMQFKSAKDHQDRFDNIDFDDMDISRALAALGQMSGMNILVGRGVTGRVTANLQNVTAEEALDAITKSLGYVYEREGNFVFVWTATDSLARKQAARKTISKVLRPRYVSVKDLQALITPMLTKLAPVRR